MASRWDRFKKWWRRWETLDAALSLWDRLPWLVRTVLGWTVFNTGFMGPLSALFWGLWGRAEQLPFSVIALMAFAGGVAMMQMVALAAARLRRAREKREKERKRRAGEIAQQLVQDPTFQAAHRRQQVVPPPEEERVTCTLDVEQLFEIYSSELRDRADQEFENYKGTWLTVEGPLTYRSEAGPGIVAAGIQVSKFKSVMGAFSDENWPYLRQLSEGDTVRFAGEVSSVQTGYVSLRRCEIITDPDRRPPQSGARP